MIYIGHFSFGLCIVTSVSVTDQTTRPVQACFAIALKCLVFLSRKLKLNNSESKKLMNKLPYICQIRPKPPKKGMLSCCCVNVLSKNERRTFFIGIFVSVVQSKHLYHKRQESSALLVRNLSVFVCAPPGGISTCHSYLCTKCIVSKKLSPRIIMADSRRGQVHVL